MVKFISILNSACSDSDDPDRSRPVPAGGKIAWSVVAACVLISAIQTRNSLKDGGDGGTVYFASRAFMAGQNPYDHDALASHDDGYPLGPRINPALAPSVYPPSTILAHVPLATLPWYAANVVNFSACFAMAIAFVPTLTRLVPGCRRYPICCVLAAAVLLWGPMITAIKTKQPSIAAGLLLAMSIAADKSGHRALAAVILGLSSAIKPQLSLPLYSYYLLIGRWKLPAWAATLAALANVVGIVVMSKLRIDWYPSWLQNVEYARRTVNSVAAANPLRFQLIDLRILYGSITDDEPSGLLNFCTAALLSVPGIAVLLAAKRSRDAIPALSAALVLGLLAFYHRYYDAIVLLIPLAWSLDTWLRHRRLTAGLALLLMTPFFISGAWGLDYLEQRDMISSGLTGRWWWRCVIKPHQAWCLLGLYAVLIAETLREHRTAEDWQEHLPAQVKRSGSEHL
jgi:hypothetical protein